MLVAEPLSDPARLAARAIHCALPAVLRLAPSAPAAEFLGRKTIPLLDADAPVLPILIPGDRGLRSALEPSVPGGIHCYTDLLGGRHLGTGVPARDGCADEHRAYPEPAVWELDRW